MMKVKETSILTNRLRCPGCSLYMFIPIEDFIDLNGYGGILELEIPSSTRVECPRCHCEFWVHTHSSTVSWITVGEVVK